MPTTCRAITHDDDGGGDGDGDSAALTKYAQIPRQPASTGWFSLLFCNLIVFIFCNLFSSFFFVGVFFPSLSLSKVLSLLSVQRTQKEQKEEKKPGNIRKILRMKVTPRQAGVVELEFCSENVGQPFSICDHLEVG